MEIRSEAVEAGRKAAEGPPVAGWGLAGFFFALIAVLVVYARSPRLPAALAAAVDREDLPV